MAQETPLLLPALGLTVFKKLDPILNPQEAQFKCFEASQFRSEKGRERDTRRKETQGGKSCRSPWGLEKLIRTHSADVATDNPSRNAANAILPDLWPKGDFD